MLDGCLVCTVILYYYTQRDGKHQITVFNTLYKFLFIIDAVHNMIYIIIEKLLRAFTKDITCVNVDSLQLLL
jgi:hypothetical protein